MTAAWTHTHTHVAANQTGLLLFIGKHADQLGAPGPTPAKAVTPVRECTRVPTSTQTAWSHKHQEKNTTQQEGKVAGSKVFADSNFGIEIAGKQKGTKSGLETWLLGLSGQPTAPGSPGLPHRLWGVAVRLAL